LADGSKVGGLPHQELLPVLICLADQEITPDQPFSADRRAPIFGWWVDQGDALVSKRSQISKRAQISSTPAYCSYRFALAHPFHTLKCFAPFPEKTSIYMYN
jgi:hypothetical protein